MRSPFLVTSALALSLGVSPSGSPQPIPNPSSHRPGCWSWSYDPNQPIPVDAKVVPGHCATPDGRCYVVPSSACFELTGVEEPLFDERSRHPAPPGLDPPPGPETDPPRDPLRPPRLRPTHPTGHAPTPLPESEECTPGTGWDFENFLENEPGNIRGYASFDGWKGGGDRGVSPFKDLENVDVSWKAAPVYGNAVPIHRIRPPGWRPDIASLIGGDYWLFSQDINQSGDFWIGSLDRRYSWRHHPGETRDSWGEEAIGTLTSPECTLRARYLSFRLGGSGHGSQRVEVHVQGASPREYFGVRLRGGPGDPSFDGAMGYPTQYISPDAIQAFLPPVGQEGWSVVRSAMPDDVLDSDWMQLYVFDLEPFVGGRIRIRIVDDRREECAFWFWGRCFLNEPEHLQADDFLFREEPPPDVEWMLHSDGLCGGVPGSGENCSPVGRVASEPPIWGFTDVHAHPMANVAFGGHVFWGDVTDSLEEVYDCSQSLDAIPGPGGRERIDPPHRRTSCYLHGSVIAIATGLLLPTCNALNIVPFVGTAAAAACALTVSAAAAVASNVPVLSGATLHGASKWSSGAVKLGALFSGLLDVLPDYALGFSVGLIPEVDSFTKASGTESGGWWKKDESWHNPTGIGKTHNAYQADMIRRAYHGGLRLGVWDVINSRALGLIADGTMPSDWQALKDGTDAARRIVGNQLGDIAEIAYSPAEAERIIRAGKMAVILGSEVDELGRMRPEGLPWPRSPRTGPDSMQKQVDDLWELGIRKITPVHAVNNPIGGTALFYTKYNSNNFFLSGTEPDRPPTPFDLPAVQLVLDESFGSVLRDLSLGEFSLIYDVVQPRAPSWNPADWFDFDLRPSVLEDRIGEYDRITYRIGIDGFNGSSLKRDGEWLGPQEVLGTQVLRPRLLKGLASLALAGPSCDLYNTTLPEPVKSFGPTVDLHYIQADGHRNALGMHQTDGSNDGEAFLRAAMKKGMLIDTDHLSQNMRLDLYDLANRYAEEAGWPMGPCPAAERAPCVGYPFVGVHSKVRGLEIDPKPIEEMRNAYGYNDEASRSEREVELLAESGGAFALFPTGSAIIPPNTRGGRCSKDSDCANYNGPGSGTCRLGNQGWGVCETVLPALAHRDFELPPEVGNDCDASSKTFAVKYLWLMKTTRGRGLTPATDMNGLIGTLRPRYGNALRWNSPCAGDERDRTDQARLPGQRTWRRMMYDAQRHESSGIWYEDYATRGPTPAPVAIHWNDDRYKQVVARRHDEQREDLAPRAPVDDLVFYNDFGPDNALHRGYTYQDGNRPGAQMYPMKRWQTLAGRAGWDFNLDGLAHIGLFPDLLQDMRNVGVQWEQMGPLVHSARDYILTWNRAVSIGAAHP